MGRESQAWATLRDRLAVAGVTTRRLTDRIDCGMPDVLWVDRATEMCGLIETKAVEKLPVRGGGVKVEFQPGQQVWIYKWAAAGGRACVLTRVTRARIWILTPGSKDPSWVHQVTQSVQAVPHVVFEDDVPTSAIIQHLVRNSA